MTNSKTLRIREEPAIALYEETSDGSFKEDFSKGRVKPYDALKYYVIGV